MVQMTWTKAKKQLKSLTCDSLQGRLDFHIINYRKAHDQLGRAVITLDKEEIFNMCTLTTEAKEFEKTLALSEYLNEDELEQNTSIELQQLAQQELAKEGVFAQYDFFEALARYFNESIEESLTSDHDLVKLLSLIDRRVGKRTLVKLADTIDTESALVQQFYYIRMKSENLA
ncbi:hypothetical protein FA707_02755 [Vagococcus zengguangii]|uniref:Uncharacterized protein n=1 Tax=Vagococcus zengguangii TaxID=2571750 RepID=A0A4D7CV07_9ENTE|nr:hypothetical protein [Vagococcus zengguangii]QCI85946.1 hypothetical protein FA707_02755 [Vagococcus zengguangii]